MDATTDRGATPPPPRGSATRRRSEGRAKGRGGLPRLPWTASGGGGGAAPWTARGRLATTGEG